MKIYLIRCSTGCTCCSDDNHYRGPYQTREEAERRIKFFKETGDWWPVASRYSNRGNYSICEYEIEILPGDDRYIIDNTVIDRNPYEFIVVFEDGSIVKTVEEERFWDLKCY